MGALALGGLSACRSDAGTAAFVGNTRFTDAQVTKAALGVKTPGVSSSDVKHDYVLNLVYIEVLRKYAAATGVTLTEPTADYLSQLATQFDAPTTDPFVVAQARTRAYAESLAAKATPATPTDAELQPMFQRAVAAQLADPTAFDTFKSTIMGVPGFTNFVGLQKELVKSETNDNISINPRYAAPCTASPCSGFQFDMLPLGNGQGQQFSSVILPLGPDSTPAVLDQSQAPAPAAGN